MRLFYCDGFPSVMIVSSGVLVLFCFAGYQWMSLIPCQAFPNGVWWFLKLDDTRKNDNTQTGGDRESGYEMTLAQPSEKKPKNCRRWNILNYFVTNDKMGFKSSRCRYFNVGRDGLNTIMARHFVYNWASKFETTDGEYE